MEICWKQINTTETPTPRSKHTASYIEFNNSILVFGGHNETALSNDLFSFDLSNCTWTQIHATGQIPTKREYHVSVVYQDKLYIFGGFDGTRQNDLYSFCIATKKWNKVVTTGQIPSNREDCSAVVFQDKMFIFGGWDGIASNDVFEFSFQTSTWKKVNATGELPSKRYKHSAVLWRENMIIFGGCCGNTLKRNNDLYALNLQNFNWSAIQAKGDIPSARYRHIAVVIKNEMFVFGGDAGVLLNDLYRFDLENRVWSKIQTSGKIPSPRREHVAIVKNGSIIVFGGFDGNNLCNDLYELHIGTKNNALTQLKNLFEKELFYDVEFLVDGVKFHAHICIVTQSKTLDDLIENKLRNPCTKPLKIELSNVSAEAFYNMLLYMYCGQTKKVDANLLVELMNAAKIFKLEGLEKQCITHFDNIVQIDNVLDILTKSNQFQLSTLKSLCLKYFYENQEQVMKQSKVKLPNELLVELLQVIASTKLPVQTEHARIAGEHPVHSHILTLFRKHRYCDITLISSDKKKVMAHKALLVTFSEFFQTMFCGHFLESYQSEVDMNEIDSETLKFIVEYLYNGEVSDMEITNSSTLINLIRIADKLMLQPLISFAVKKLSMIVNPKNALNIFQCCVEFNIAGELKDKSWQILKKTSQDDLVQTIIETQLKQNQELLELRKTVKKQNEVIEEITEHYCKKLEEFSKRLQAIETANRL